MFRYFIRLSFNGARYHGWQVQKNAPSVQETITRAINLIWGTDISLVGCGRTDTGVHAKEFFAHFNMAENRSKEDLDQLCFRLNRFLPDDIAIYRIFPVSGEMHARFSAVSRAYQYFIHTEKDTFLNDFSWFVHDFPDLEMMNEGAALIRTYEDFTSFSKLHSAAKTNICHITEAAWEKGGHHQLIFTITADRFLRNMVRAIVGTLVDLGHHKIDLEQLKRIIEGKDRCLAGESVPGKGLFLMKVVYDTKDSILDGILGN